MPTFDQYSDALATLAADSETESYDLCSIDPFGPATREEAMAVIYPNLGCGAGNTVCSISLSGEVNPCSFLGPRYAAANVRERALPDIWHGSAGFQSIRALPDAAATDGVTFSGGCRARSLVLSGSINAPDPWLAASHGPRRAGLVAGPATALQPLSVLEVTRRTPARSAVAKGNI
jgi:MoaA/NifB/PqqE/SkfB family radical SAM enzyme